jgi:hypothetical protein
MYARLPVFKYQTFDRESLTFSEHPIKPPSPRKMRYFGSDADADEPPKNDDAPVDPPADAEPPDPPIEILDLPADPPADTEPSDPPIEILDPPADSPADGT